MNSWKFILDLDDLTKWLKYLMWQLMNLILLLLIDSVNLIYSAWISLSSKSALIVIIREYFIPKQFFVDIANFLKILDGNSKLNFKNVEKLFKLIISFLKKKEHCDKPGNWRSFMNPMLFIISNYGTQSKNDHQWTMSISSTQNVDGPPFFNFGSVFNLTINYACDQLRQTQDPINVDVPFLCAKAFANSIFCLIRNAIIQFLFIQCYGCSRDFPCNYVGLMNHTSFFFFF